MDSHPDLLMSALSAPVGGMMLCLFLVLISRLNVVSLWRLRCMKLQNYMCQDWYLSHVSQTTKIPLDQLSRSPIDGEGGSVWNVFMPHQEYQVSKKKHGDTYLATAPILPNPIAPRDIHAQIFISIHNTPLSSAESNLSKAQASSQARTKFLSWSEILEVGSLDLALSNQS